MMVVSNASSIINLARIGKLDLLRDLYGEIVVPQGVWHEVVEEGTGQTGADEVKGAAWIVRHKTKTIGNNVAIGPNAVLSKSVPDNAVVLGNPGRIVSFEGSEGLIESRDEPFFQSLSIQ